MAQLSDTQGTSSFSMLTLPVAQQPIVQQNPFKRIFRFPNPVNEYAARFTAALVLLLALLTLATGWGWGLVILTVGFFLRVLFGPRISPFALLSVKVLAPRLAEPKLVAGPPKRFAQGIGAFISLSATFFYFSGNPLAAWGLLVLLIVAAALESLLAFCLGCVIFGFLQRRGVIPASVCEACEQISLRSAPRPSQ